MINNNKYLPWVLVWCLSVFLYSIMDTAMYFHFLVKWLSNLLLQSFTDSLLQMFSFLTQPHHWELKDSLKAKAQGQTSVPFPIIQAFICFCTTSFLHVLWEHYPKQSHHTFTILHNSSTKVYICKRSYFRAKHWFLFWFHSLKQWSKALNDPSWCQHSCFTEQLVHTKFSIFKISHS